MSVVTTVWVRMFFVHSPTPVPGPPRSARRSSGAITHRRKGLRTHDLVFYALAAVHPRQCGASAPARAGPADPEPRQPRRHPGGAGRGVLRPARLARADHHRGHTAVRGRPGLPEHPRHLHSRTHRGMAKGRRRGACRRRSAVHPTDARRPDVAPGQHPAPPSAGRPVGDLGRAGHVHSNGPAEDAGAA